MLKASSENQPEKGSITEEDKTLDQEFIDCMLEIEKKYINFKKHDKIRIEQWTKKLCQVTTNVIWKKNRNLYGKLLLSNVLNRNLQEPFTRGPPEGALPKLNKAEISSKLGKPIKSVENANNINNLNTEGFSPEKKQMKTLGTLGNSPGISDGSNKKLDKKLFYSTTNVHEETHTNTKEVENELEIMKLNEKELRNELKQKTEENESLKKELNEKKEDEKHLKTDHLEMHAVLEKIQVFFQSFEKKIEKIGNFKALQKELDEVLDPEKKENRVFEDEKLETKKHDFDNFLTDAYAETGKFLEKLEQFQKKTELLKKEVDENCKNSGE